MDRFRLRNPQVTESIGNLHNIARLPAEQDQEAITLDSGSQRDRDGVMSGPSTQTENGEIIVGLNEHLRGLGEWFGTFIVE